MLKFYLLVLLILFYGIDCRAQQGKVGEQVRHFVEREHVGSVAFRYRRILVGFDEDAISPTAMPALATVSIISGRPPVTPVI